MDSELQVAELKREVELLKGELFNDNFSAFQEFKKFSNFTSRLKVPHFDTLPSTCEVGEIAEQGGELNICSAANTWTVVGTQS